MSNKIKGFTVALEKEVSEEKAQQIKDAILQIRFVANVTESISSPSDWINQAAIKRELASKLWEVLK